MSKYKKRTELEKGISAFQVDPEFEASESIGNFAPRAPLYGKSFERPAVVLASETSLRPNWTKFWGIIEKLEHMEKELHEMALSIPEKKAS